MAGRNRLLEGGGTRLLEGGGVRLLEGGGVPPAVVPTRTGELEWDADDVSGALAWDADDVAGALTYTPAAGGVLTWG
jgi:hypothetical protein